MHLPRTRRILAGVFLAAALAPAASAQASTAGAPATSIHAAVPQERCDQRLERLEARFYEIAERRGYEAATAWWDKRWEAYHERCVV